MSQYPQGIFQTLTWLVKQVKILFWKVQQVSPLPAPYKKYTALLTQSGGSNPSYYTDPAAGPGLTIGVTYSITDGILGDDDFTNVGAPAGEIYPVFIATGTTPNVWDNSTRTYFDTGAPVATVLENTIGNVWFTYGTNGRYYLNSANLFTGTIPTIVGPMGITGDIAMDVVWTAYGFKKNNDNEIIFETGIPGAGGRNNDYLTNQFIEIRMYN